ncbi:PKD domain-containing protein [Micromonospora sp. NPDC050397]|uniref:PKD domain-containing protein n=1 Tax=Micromonospora sp. NPDC050397 TaxID=3364279 RepID=UPI00384B68D0
MAETHGYDIVIQATSALPRKALREAWRSGTVPRYLPIPAGIDLGGGHTTAGGQIEVAPLGLDAELLPTGDGCRLVLGLVVQVTLADPPVPSARLLDLTATVRAQVPIGTLPDSRDVGIRLGGLPRDAVTVTVTSGAPTAGKIDQLLAEYVHLGYENGGPGGVIHPGAPVFPHERDDTGQGFSFGAGGYRFDTHLELYDDQSQPAYRIEVGRPGPTQALFSVPCYLRLWHAAEGTGPAPTGTSTPTSALAEPMGIGGRLEILVDLETSPGAYTLRFDTATVTAAQIAPAPGLEGTNYTLNNSALFGLLEPALRGWLAEWGGTLVAGFGPRTVPVPTTGRIEAMVADVFHADLGGRDHLALWTPGAGAEPFEARDVTTRVALDALTIAVNAGPGADIAAVGQLVPTGRDFAIALPGPVLRAAIEAARAANGWSDADLPRRFERDDTRAEVRELELSLTDSGIRMTGALTVVDAILGCVDVDVTFRSDADLRWNPDGGTGPDGVQALEVEVVGDPELDPERSVAYWLVAIVLGLTSWGAGSILVGIAAVVTAAVLTGIAATIGGSRAVDPRDGTVRGISGWPGELAGIGRVRAVFHNPVTIGGDGLVVAGTLEVTSSCARTAVLVARSGGSYAGTAGTPITLTAGNTDPAARYVWRPGDGSPPVTTRDLAHTYFVSGVHLATHSLTVTGPGGATSHHFALVHVANVPPTVDAGPDVVVDEGELVTLVGRFSDREWTDTHETTWNFGDNSPTEPGTLAETNTPPRAEGTSTARHAWCDDGVYEVTLRVRDRDGGVATDTRLVTVRNVPPVVDAGPDLFTYPATVLTLTAAFSDPGWCDTHTATWAFGDTTAAIPAVVTETHQPPASRGTAVAAHRYPDCGTFVARCTVVDDDGGVGSDEVVVRAIDVVNRHFEDGFAQRGTGAVAIGWEPYLRSASSGNTAARHTASNFVVHGGRRAQGLQAGARERVGIHQRIGANPDWSYQLTAWYDLDQARPGTARLGVDPAGGVDPGAGSVVWSDGTATERWSPLTVRVTAGAAAITVFLEAYRADGRDPAPGAERVWFDDVELLAAQPYCPPVAAPAAEAALDFADRDRGTQFPPEWSEQDFSLRTPDGGARAVVSLEPPADGTALRLGLGLVIRPPRPAERVTLTLLNAGGRPLSLIAVDAGGNVRDRAQLPPASQALPAAVVLTGPGIVAVRIDGRGAEAFLVRCRAVLGTPVPPAPREPVHPVTPPPGTGTVERGWRG